ncbi:MAG: 30S ribosomal protein S2 [Bacteroidia bacterium]|nr:MAG: 30S ribosomal protein S2 [Bacteroidia bacterium]
MSKIEFDDLLKAGVHFGHLKRKWNPKMAPYIFMEKNGIHLIDLYKTSAKLEEATAAIKQIAKSGRQILFVATKKQAKEILVEKIKPTGMPYIVERWSGGMLTNFRTIRKAIKKMNAIDVMEKDGTFDKISKRERLQIRRERAKLEKNLGSIIDMKRVPSALFVVDVTKEHIAVAEAKKLGIPIFAMVDTNSDPSVDFPIPSNDDAAKSISIIVGAIADAVQEGIAERRAATKEERDSNENQEEGSKTKARK